MKISILIITNRCVYWLDTIKKCLKPAGFFNKRNDEYFMENELFKIEIKSEFRETRGQRYDIAVIDKYIPKSILLEMLYPVVKQRYYTDNYYSEAEQHILLDYYTHNLDIKLKWYQKILIKIYDTVLTQKRNIMKRRNKK